MVIATKVSLTVDRRSLYRGNKQKPEASHQSRSLLLLLLLLLIFPPGSQVYAENFRSSRPLCCDFEATTRRDQQIRRSSSRSSRGSSSFPTQIFAIFAPLIMSGNSIEYYLSPRRRLDTLFAVHSAFSVVIGTIGFLFPSTASVFFSDRE